MARPVRPSREEGMSIALLEAMALGVPLVASSIPGNRRLIREFQHGRLTPPDDPPALARVIARVNTFIVLSLLYYLVITPLGVILRLSSGDPLDRAWGKETSVSVRVGRHRLCAPPIPLTA